MAAIMIKQTQERSMADRRRGESKELKKDQHVRREVLGDIGAEIVQEHTTPQHRNPNRDQRAVTGTDPAATATKTPAAMSAPGDDGLRRRAAKRNSHQRKWSDSRPWTPRFAAFSARRSASSGSGRGLSGRLRAPAVQGAGTARAEEVSSGVLSDRRMGMSGPAARARHPLLSCRSQAAAARKGS